MKKHTILFTAFAAGALFLTAPTANAATNTVSTHATSSLIKGKTYKLRLKVPGRLTVKGSNKYTIKNVNKWNAVAYPGKTKDTKVYYLRSGNYTITTTANAKIKTSFTKLTSLRKDLDTFPIMSKEEKPKVEKIQSGQTIKGLLNMYHTYKFDTWHDYEITLDKPKKVTLDVNTMPVYHGHMSKLGVDLESLAKDFNAAYDFAPYDVSGGVRHRTFSWYVGAGSYNLSFSNLTGQYNFKLTEEDTDQIPGAVKITNIKSTDQGVQVDYTPTDHATKYGIYYNVDNNHSGYLYGNPAFFSNTTSGLIPNSSLVNGENLTTAVIGINEPYKAYGTKSAVKQFTYYRPLTSNDKTPVKPNINLDYYDDHGNDEPYISVKWNENKAVDSYEVAYRVKGTSEWKSFITGSKSKTEIDREKDFKKGTQYEVRVRALTSSLKSDWSDIKTVTITNNPA
ncbi:fibronectin type III domain-containing protein [Lactobacillus sp. PV037]|uniref:fibronectin type III domain-containing protein n=1 Tax=unclassified Lactobacillus TaxID=2620435 RepID=UPI00224083EF|nr:MULTISPECIES: fibronectin type III domain-containing protein [unclassified Lactobacillus]QNQ82256.1 fibronectin type III domain-containing protein [Lactobacillus sp. PV012]QNQ83633.1 fibronectin type III domain-containing protein [Lactobacillus sp. PV037]